MRSFDAKTKRRRCSAQRYFARREPEKGEDEFREGTLTKLNEVPTSEQQTELKSKMEAAKAKPPAQP
jgi:hypothetical protein